MSLKFAGIAQLVEQLICNQQVAGSSPVASSRRTESESWLSGQKQQTVNLPGFALRRFESFSLHQPAGGSNSVGRVTAFQAVGRGFESRLPLYSIDNLPLIRRGGTIEE